MKCEAAPAILHHHMKRGLRKEKITESHENLHSLSYITPEKALLYHKKYKKTRKNALQEIDKKIQLCYN